MGKENLKRDKLINQNKGQKEMVEAFVNGLLNDGKAPIPFEEL